MQKPVVEPPQVREPAPTWWIMGRIAVRRSASRIERATPMPADGVGREATGKACGVLVAMLQGKSWAPHPVERSAVNVGTISGSLPSGHPGRQRAGSSSADGLEVGRSPRSSPSVGKATYMAKGDSEFAVMELECQEVAGEYRRSVARPR